MSTFVLLLFLFKWNMNVGGTFSKKNPNCSSRIWLKPCCFSLAIRCFARRNDNSDDHGDDDQYQKANCERTEKLSPTASPMTNSKLKTIQINKTNKIIFLQRRTKENKAKPTSKIVFLPAFRFERKTRHKSARRNNGFWRFFQHAIHFNTTRQNTELNLTVEFDSSSK